jgi:cytochrome c oxidase subunit II
LRSHELNRRGRRGLAAAAVLPLLVLLTGCSTTLERGFLPSDPGTTNQTERIMTLWNGSWIALLLVGALVWGLMLWCVVAYRRRRDDVGLPPQVQYHVPLEILYTVVPLMMIAVLFIDTARDESAIAALSPKPDLTINVVAKQWAWDFNYLGDLSTPADDYYEAGLQAELDGKPGVEKTLPTLYLPVDKNVRFILTSRDVIHSFWISAFLYKLDVVPGLENTFEVTPKRIGDFQGKCAELCGEYHSEMLFNVKVVSEQDYDAHLAALKAAGNVGTLDTNLGRELTPKGGAVPGATNFATRSEN